MMSSPTVNVTSHNTRPPRSLASKPAARDSSIVAPDDRVLVTGAEAFIGSRVVETLVDRGFRNIVCFARPSSELAEIEVIVKRRPLGSRIGVFKGNLLSPEDSEAASKDGAVMAHLAADPNASNGRTTLVRRR
jgi:nucleoside-diphosphate-sugar epimerase